MGSFPQAFLTLIIPRLLNTKISFITDFPPAHPNVEFMFSNILTDPVEFNE